MACSFVLLVLMAVFLGQQGVQSTAIPDEVVDAFVENLLGKRDCAARFAKCNQKTTQCCAGSCNDYLGAGLVFMCY